MADVIEKKGKKSIYMNDARLKAPGVQMEWSQSDMDEFVKCKGDIIYFIETYMKIVHVDHGVIPFNLYDYQKNVIDLYDKHRFVTLKFPRQSGKCSDFSTCIHVRNKKTGISKKITIGEFYAMQKHA